MSKMGKSPSNKTQSLHLHYFVFVGFKHVELSVFLNGRALMASCQVERGKQDQSCLPMGNQFMQFLWHRNCTEVMIRCKTLFIFIWLELYSISAWTINMNDDYLNHIQHTYHNNDHGDDIHSNNMAYNNNNYNKPDT